MPEDKSSTIEKALAINLDPLKYGSIVEIGAGQEVARWFFQAGAAAGTIAKTMSAYDMNYSDEVYGPSVDGRYVSRQRLERMLEREFDVTTSRVKEHRPPGTRFFVFANTVAAQGFNKRAECHGWLGIRLQMVANAEPDDIILHVRMLDDSYLDQQEALGILGVNIIYGAYEYAHKPEQLLKSLMDNLRWGRVEIDLVELRGPTFAHIDNRIMALELVKASLTRAVVFDPDGNVVIPADAFHHKNVVAMRGAFHTVEQGDVDMFNHAKMQFWNHPDVEETNTIALAELTMADLANDQEIDTNDFLTRVNQLSEAGYHVMISEFFRYFRVRQYLMRYTKAPVAFVTDTAGLEEIFRKDYYDGVKGGILEGLGQTFPKSTRVYVYPRAEDEERLTEEGLPIEAPLRPLYTYLHEAGKIVLVDDYDPKPGWSEMENA